MKALIVLLLSAGLILASCSTPHNGARYTRSYDKKCGKMCKYMKPYKRDQVVLFGR